MTAASAASEPGDGALADAARRGEQAAFSALFARHRAGIYRLVLAQVGDADAALDLTQESFAAAFAAIARFDPAQPFRPWLARIAINKCRDRHRRQMVRRLFSFALPLDQAERSRDPAPDPEAAAGDRDALDRTMRAIAQLPAALREPLTLCAIDDMSQREAARVLGISEKAVELRIRRARQQLAEMIPPMA